jgi:hypothetical protein
MIRAERFALDVDTFAAERRRILERSDERFAKVVSAALTRVGIPRWEDPIVGMALDIFDETVAEESDQPGQVIDDMREEFERELRETLGKTKQMSAEQRDAQAERLVKWLSTYSVNAGTEAATTSDPDGAVGLEWVTMGDNNVRPVHVETNGETVPSGLPFDVGGYELLFPGQPVGPPEIWINCRCVARPTMLEEFKVKTEFKSEATSLEESAETSSSLEVELPEADGSGTPSQMSPDPSVSVTAAAEEGPLPDEEEDPDAPTEIPEEEFEPVPWYGVLAPEGVPSGDGRSFDTNGLTHRDLPLPLKAMFVDDEGHKGSVIVGRIDNIFREDGLIKGEGVFDDSDAAYETVRMLAEGMWRGVSVDIDDMQAQLSEDGSSMSATGRICAATVCAIPAFAEAFVGLGRWADQQLVDQLPPDSPDSPDVSRETLATETETFAPVPPKTMDGPGWITDPVPTRRITDYWVDGRGALKIRWGAPGDFNRCRRQLIKYVQNPEWLAGLCANLHFRALHVWPGQEGGGGHRGRHSGGTVDMALTAAAEPEVLPGRYFKDPELVGPTPFTVTEDGRVYGHVATWDACHIGLPIDDDAGECTTAPHSQTNYAYFLTGEILTDLGPVAVGQITMGGGHATDRMGVRAAVSHYDSTSTAVADVTAGEDDHGIWVAGLLRPNVTEDQVRELRAAAISGDWRRVAIGREGNLELVAALAVNVPGFPIPRASMLVASGGEPLTLVAASIPLHDGQDAGDNVEIPTSTADLFKETRAKFRALQVARYKGAFATLTEE